MNTSRFERLSKAMASKRVNRQESPDATPEAESVTDEKVEFLFVQTYQSGTISPTEGNPRRYTLSLESGTGQTVYFSNRPERIAGSAPTPQFLAGLGFFDDNPPNAALVFEAAPENTDVAVIELYNPMYDPESQGVTYEVEVLANWEKELALGFQEAPTDLSAIASSFGAAQLFIDDCADADMWCINKYSKEVVKTIPNSLHDGFCYSWSAWMCLPCQPRITDSKLAEKYWIDWCNLKNFACGDNDCTIKGFWY
jgi:hypothetical protein